MTTAPQHFTTRSSSSPGSVSTIADASRLVQFGLQPRLLPARNEEYTDLVARYRADDTFAEAVRAVCVGMDLVVQDVDMAHGLVASSSEGSVFEVKMSDYAKRTGNGPAAERVLHGLALLGVAVMAYPRPADLENETHVARVTAAGVDAFVREACKRLEEKLQAAELESDPSVDEPNLEAAFRVYQRRAADPSSGDGRKVESSTIGKVSRVLNFLVEQGQLRQTSKDDGGTYTTTSRFRVEVKEAGSRMFADLLDLGISQVVDGTGTLQTTSEWTDGALRGLR